MASAPAATFVIAWSQTEVDGLRAAAPARLAVGASWRWTGAAVCIDAQGGLLRLGRAEGEAQMRHRAARMVQRLLGMALEPPSAQAALQDGRFPDAGQAEAAEGLAQAGQGFVLSDGRRSYVATMIAVPDTGSWLLMFLGAPPPAGQELWVVQAPAGLPKHLPAAPTEGVICFLPGTLIRTLTGEMPVEALRPGDLVQTKDNGVQPVLWTGMRRMSGARLYAMPQLRPIRVRHSALGHKRPHPDLLVSPRHRLLVRGATARELFGTDEVLVAAEDLLNDHSILRDRSLREVSYHHLLLGAHEVVFANGLETESFHPATAGLATLEPLARRALLAVLPGLDADPHSYGDHARRPLTGPEAAILRHRLGPRRGR